MNRTLKEAAQPPRKRLNTLCGLTPFEPVCKARTGESHRFRPDPIHLTLGLNTESGCGWEEHLV